MKQENFRRIAIHFALLFLAAAITAMAFIFWIKTYSTAPAGTRERETIFTISHGQGLATVADHLLQKGLITDAFRFKIIARYRGDATRLKAGEYLLSPTFSPSKILDLIVSGKVRLYRLTVPEGYNMAEIATLVQGAGLCASDRFLSLGRDPEVIRGVDLPGKTLEGYLFPDTYLYAKNATCRQIIGQMTDGFKRVFTREWKKRAKVLGFTENEIVTLASMIEKETGDGRERPLISSVFHNRLKRGMRLESDPTVIYGVEDYHGRIRYRHLRRVTPYNTYQIEGLPAGPIANPGEKSLEAALYPAQSDYLFFVSKNDGTHKFSRTLAEHNRAVQKYQLNR